MRISDWSSDVCSSDLPVGGAADVYRLVRHRAGVPDPDARRARHVPAPARLGVVAAGVHRTGDERASGPRAVAAAQPQGHPPRARLGAARAAGLVVLALGYGAARPPGSVRPPLCGRSLTDRPPLPTGDTP